jgi:hypothetical protein
MLMQFMFRAHSLPTLHQSRHLILMCIHSTPPVNRHLRTRPQIDIGALTVRSKRFADRDELLPMCSRCSTPNPLLSAQAADACVHCRAPFLRSLHTVCNADILSSVL